MARYDDQHKQATKARILETSGRRLKSDGIDGSGVATLMKDAGLTNGAFYAHFDTKDDLVAAVVAHELDNQLKQISELAPGPEGVEVLVRQYLSAPHRDNPAAGCPSAALLDEIARGSTATRSSYTEGLLAIIDHLEERLAEGSSTSSVSRARGLSAFALLVGTLQVARSLTDPDLSDQVIATGLETALQLLELRGADDRT